MDTASISSVLLTKGLEIAPYVLSHQDRNILSASYGYFERKYWAWKSAAMPDASNMYALYYLALLWSLDTRTNPFYEDDYILDAISGGIDRWISLQHRDGSFDQMFPHEHSVGATSYTLLAVLETIELLGELICGDTAFRMMRAIERAGTFLLSNEETYGVISNHIALFAYTFHRMYQLTGDPVYREKAHKQIEIILHNMSTEGWFKEYVGADPGYQTQCTYYLARLLEEGFDELKRPLKISITDYLPFFVHPDGSLGGYYGCRNSSIVYPGGLPILAGKYPQARRILEFICDGINKGTTPSPGYLDFPNAFRLGCNYLVAWRYLQASGTDALQDGGGYRLPCEEIAVEKTFNDAGVYIKGTTHYYAIVGFKKGGVIKIFDKADCSNIFDHSGYTVSIGKRLAATQAMDSPEVDISRSGFNAKHPFFVVRQAKMTPLSYLIIHSFSLILFRFKQARELFKKFLVHMLITRKTRSVGRCEREMDFFNNEIRITDVLTFQNTKSCRSLRGLVDNTTYHMASMSYFDFSRPKKKKELFIPYLPLAGIRVRYLFSFPTNGEYEITVNSINEE